MIGVVAFVALFVLLVWHQSRGVSSRQLNRRTGLFGELAKEAPAPQSSGRMNARFRLVPRRAIRTAAMLGGVAAACAVGLWFGGYEPLAVVAAVIAVGEAAVVVQMVHHNRFADQWRREGGA